MESSSWNECHYIIYKVRVRIGVGRNSIQKLDKIIEKLRKIFSSFLRQLVSILLSIYVNFFFETKIRYATKIIKNKDCSLCSAQNEMQRRRIWKA